VADQDNEVLFSLASCWELAIKHGLGKLRVSGSLERFIPEQLTLNGFALLGVEFRHVLRVATLPFHHRHPFDRLLATQALEEQLAIVSADRVFRKYGVTTIW
jgi:PIN domain nuclease of toxin-antitoxin system